MIERLQLRDFQKHELFRVTLDPHVTTIVGPSNAGKSSVIRAVQWAILNNLRSDRFIRHGAKTAEVKIRVDGHDITRSRSKDGDNTFHMDDQEFRSFGNGVPEPISRMLNVDEGINFQRQHDPVFWFSETAGQVSRNLNGIVDLAIIDQTLFNLNTRLRTAISEDAASAIVLKEAQTEANSVAFVPSLVKDFETISELETRLSTLQTKTETLKTNCEKLRLTRRREEARKSVLLVGLRVVEVGERKFTLSTLLFSAKTNKSNIVDPLPNIDRFVTRRAFINQRDERRNSLDKLVESAKIHHQRIKEVPDITTLETAHRQLTEASTKLHAMTMAVEEADTLSAKFNTIKFRLNEAENELNQIKICPTCKRPLT